MRRIRLVLAVALTMVALMLATSPAMAQNRGDNGDRDNGNRANQSDHRNWNDRDRADRSEHTNWNDRKRNDRDWNPRSGSGITFCGWYPSWWGWSYWCYSPWWGWWRLW
jgi:hypothetical protein